MLIVLRKQLIKGLYADLSYYKKNRRKEIANAVKAQETHILNSERFRLTV